MRQAATDAGAGSRVDPSWTLGSLFGPQQTDPTDNCHYKMEDPFIALLEFLKARKLFELYHNGSFLDAIYTYD